MHAMVAPAASPAAPKGPGGRVLLAGGYTAGHVNCMLAIAAELARLRPRLELQLAGARGGPEVGAAARAGLPIATTWIAGIDRRRGPRALARNLLLPLKLAVSALQARALLARFRPDLVIGVGGYASFPVVAAAQLAGIPTLLHEANALPGVANRLLARRARLVCVGRARARDRFPSAIVTGNPTAPGVAPRPSATSRRALGLPADRRTLLVTGGSLGHPELNRWVLRHQRALAAAAQVLWQCGPAHLETCRAGVSEEAVRVTGYLDDMAAAYGAADLVIAAGGALTVAELARIGKPALLVAARHVAEDHQVENLRDLDADELVAEADDRLLARALALLPDDAALGGLGARLASLATPDAAARIASEALRLLP
jgi:UDP-N-acetylglucosamine--N-acetylmuramyl-(pentapeptide) pyrophosphoryl-undecaprenol N-acetylglucosamine transferase